jgi:predicted PurR-regulated permease PerM
VLIGACLYWAQAVLIPIALAILITFLLGPLVSGLRRIGVPQTPAVLLVVGTALGATLVIGWTLGHQVARLAHELPQYRFNITKKIGDIRAAQRGSLKDVQDSANAVMRELQKGEEAGRKDQPVPVTVVPPGMIQWLPGIPRLTASVGFVILLVVFMLIRRQKLRSRLILVLGHGRLTVTTKALDDAGSRISRYLLMQTLMNGSFGAALAVGFFLIGLPYAFLWGALAALLRFVPYIGAWIGAAVPLVMGFAVFSGWSKLLLMLGLVLAVELVIGYVIEPWLYGRSVGVSEVALLVGAAFWTSLWGPMGLLLSTPMTVCLVVLARNLKALDFLVVLMDEEADLAPEITYYQRLLAADRHEAGEIARESLKTRTMDKVFDEVLLPALSYARRDRAAGRITEEEEDFVLSATREIVEDIATRPAASGAEAESGDPARVDAGASPPPVRILAVPATDEADEISLLMLEQILDARHFEVELAGAALLTSDVVARAADEEPAAVIITALAPGGLARARHLCKRLRIALPQAKIVVGRWGARRDRRDELLAGGADRVGATIAESRSQLYELLPVLRASRSPGGSSAGNRERGRPATLSGSR